MATVPCRSGGNPVDTTAAVCPNCSALNPAQGRAETPAGVRVQPAGAGRVVIAGVDIPFGDLVMLIIKVALASIPAYIILFILFMAVAAVFGGLFAGLAGMAGGM